MKLLRKIYGAVNEKGQWRIRRNMELYQLYKDLDVIMEGKWRLHWIGHIERMEESRIPIKLKYSNLEVQEDQESGG
jgi:hypothetical protein